MVYEKFNLPNGGYIERILSPDLEKDLKERVQLEQEIVDYSKYIWGRNSTEYLVGLLSSISTTKQLEVLVNNLKNKIKLRFRQELKEIYNNEYHRQKDS